MNRLRINDKNGFLIILISSLLLGIWAVRDTIALRNILLVVGAILSLMYWYKYFKNQKKLSFPDFKNKHIFDFLPILLIGCMFLWIIIHYLFFSRFPQQQWDELTSTWLRSFLACLIGSATAMAFSKKNQLIWLLWFGLFVSFAILFYQYIPKAIERNSIVVIDFNNYLYWAKFNGVLAGSILVAGGLGLILDNFILNHKASINSKDWLLHPLIILYSLMSLFLPIYSFVYIFDARNGIAIFGLLLFVFISILFFCKTVNDGDHKIIKKIIIMKKLFIILILIFLFSFLFVQQNNLNSGWRTFFKDALIAAQIDQYPNWKNLPELGFPKHENGESVAPNTYARIALATVGLRLLVQNPYGIGVVRSLPESMKEIDVHFSYYVYTHSAWIDLGLAYGVIGMLIPIFILLLLIVINFFRKNTKNKSILILFSSNFLLLYFIGEYAFQHGIEILFYFISFISFSNFFHQPQVKSHL